MAQLGLLEFADQVVESFSMLEAVLQVSTVVGILGPVVALTAWIVRRLMRRRADVLTQENEFLSNLRRKHEREIQRLGDEVAALTAAAPATIVEQMQRERRDGNEVLAVRALIRGFDAIADDIGLIAQELALHHLSTIPHMPRTGLDKAERFARIAVACRPADRERQTLLAEIIEIRANRRDTPAADALDGDDDEAVLDAIFGADADVPTLVQSLLHACDTNLRGGHYRLAERLARRAVIMARHSLGPSASLTLTARYYETVAVRFLGRSDEALDAVDALLPLHETVKGPEHPDTLSTRALRADVLSDLGHSDEARDALENLLPLMRARVPASHRRMKKAEALWAKLESADVAAD